MSTRNTAPIGYAEYANAFFRAALMVDEKLGIEKGYETIAPIPVLYLIGHSIELSLKSYFLHKGVTEKDLGSKYGHNLIKAFDATKRRSFMQTNYM